METLQVVVAIDDLGWFDSRRLHQISQSDPARSPSRPPPPNDCNTGRFDLGVTAPDTQLGGDTTDLRA